MENINAADADKNIPEIEISVAEFSAGYVEAKAAGYTPANGAANVYANVYALIYAETRKKGYTKIYANSYARAYTVARKKGYQGSRAKDYADKNHERERESDFGN